MSVERTVHLVEGDAGVRRWLARLLHAGGFAAVVYDSAASFLGSALVLASGCIVLDARMPEIDGLEIQAQLKQLGVRLPLIMISDDGDVRTVVRAMKAGAADFMAKPLDDEDLLNAIEAALAHPSHARHRTDIAEAVRRISTLSPREREVLEALMAGRPNKTIARDLGISVRTVEVHRARMLERLGARHVAVAVRLGVIATFDAD
jgi:two-component system response regulator FixJ